MSIRLARPQECSEQEINEFERLVKEGEEVDEINLKERVRRAAVLALYYDEADVVAVAALKIPNDRYRDSVFAKAKAIENPVRFTRELGWVFVTENHRGRKISSQLVEEILQFAGDTDLFATSRVGNVNMHSALKNRGFYESGTPYKSQRGESSIQLFVRSSQKDR